MCKKSNKEQFNSDKTFNIIERVKNLFQYKNHFLMHYLDTVIVSKMHEKIEGNRNTAV